MEWASLSVFLLILNESSKQEPVGGVLQQPTHTRSVAKFASSRVKRRKAHLHKEQKCQVAIHDQ